MKIKNYSGLMESFEQSYVSRNYTEVPSKQDSSKYVVPGKKSKDKKPDYSQQRKQKRGD